MQIRLLPFRSSAAIRLGLAVSVSLVAGTLNAEDWPQWRGPRGDGISIETSLPSMWSEKENLLWRTALPGQGGATPAIWGDHIFVTSAREDDLVLMAISARDGKLLWEQKVTTGNMNARAGEGNSASPSPSTDGKHVWVFFGTGVLACYDFAGKEVWKFDVEDRFGKIDIQFGMTSTPVLAGDHLYLQLIHGPMKRDDNSQTGKVIKLNKLTGETIWEFDRKTNVNFECKHSYASPFMYDDGQRKFLVVHGADCTTGHDLATGKELWRLEGLNGPSAFFAQHDDTYRFVASPGVVKGWIIVPTAKRGPTVALKVDDNLKGTVNADSKSVAWKLERTPDVSIPLVADGLVYLLHSDGKLQCLELETGKELYFERTHTSQHRASPMLAGGKIYLCAKDGMVTVVKAGPKFEIVSRNQMAEPITASPAVSGGTMFLRSYGGLYAIR